MKVSFLVTYYNQAQFVEKSLNSILSQKLEYDYEILVADDGSSDNTRDVVNSFIEKIPERIKLFIMPRDSKKSYNSILRVSAARIFLYKQAQGSYFLILDGDDWYCDDTFVQQGINILEKDGSLATCAFLYQMWYSAEKIEKVEYFKSAQRIKACKYIRSMYLHAGACIHRRANDPNQISIIEKTGVFDDNDILVNTLNYGDMYFIPKTVYSYRQTENSSWNSLSSLEKDIVNCWGYEILCRYSKFRNELFVRHINCFKSVYENKTIVQELNTEKNKTYFDYAENNKTQFLYQLLFWKNLSNKEKKRLKRRLVIRIKMYLCIKRIIQAIKRRILKLLKIKK